MNINNNNNNRRPRGSISNNRNNNYNYNNSGNINSRGGYNNSNNYNNAQRQIRYTAPYQNRQNHQNHQRRRKKKPFLVRYGFRLLMFLFFFVVISAICFLLFYVNLIRTSPLPDITYKIQTSEGDKAYSLPYNIGFANDRYYFPINDVMGYMGFVLAGSDDDFSFIRDISNEYIKIKIGTNIVYINDEEYHLSAPSFMDKDKLIYIPLESFESVSADLNFTFDEKNKNIINVSVNTTYSPQQSFTIRQPAKLAGADETAAPYYSSDPIKFKADLSQYEIYFNPPPDKADEYIVLINQTHPLNPQDYVPPDLTDLIDTRKDGRAMQQMRFYPAKALEAFLIEARANGFNNVSVTSAYRSYDYQIQLFNDEVAAMRPIHGDNAEAVAATSVAYPGQSEHQSGLCLDMHSLSAAAQEFGNEPDGKWLAENAHYFGFILRYPKDKTDITGIKYEPWHFRYVGRYHATKMYESGLCFEEYYEQYVKK